MKVVALILGFIGIAVSVVVMVISMMEGGDPVLMTWGCGLMISGAILVAGGVIGPAQSRASGPAPQQPMQQQYRPPQG